MKRRSLLLALAGGGLTGGSLWLARSGAAPESGGALPVTVETVAARGSSAGSLAVPVDGRVTVLDLFATWCSPCVEQMDALAAVHREYADADDVRVVSVTNERLGGGLTREDLRAWWRRNHGDWTLGLDPESDLLAALGANGLPHLAVFDADGSVTWEHGSGVAGAATLRQHVEAARER